MDKSGDEFQLTKHNVKKIGHRHNGRITDEAVLKVVAEEESRIGDVFRLASLMAKHAGRKTIKEEDVRKVYKFVDEADEI